MVCVQKFSETIGMCTSEFCWAVGGKIELDASAGFSKGQGCLGSHIFLWGVTTIGPSCVWFVVTADGT